MVITKKELYTILENHKHWLRQDCEGWEKMKADFHGIFLGDADFRGADLSYVDFENLILRYANLNDADLTGANLTGADLRYASLIHTILEDANLTDANLANANLLDTDLRCANLNGADLSCANLAKANLVGAHLENIIGDFTNFASTRGINDNRKGEVLTTDLIGYKKCSIGYKVNNKKGIIVKLLIPRGAIVFSINDKKCRTNKVKVLEIEGADRAYSWFNAMSYYVGDEITVYDFDCQYNIECAKGIHFFKSREEAEAF